MTTILAALVLLGVLIFVHELGHFLFAKLVRVKVLKFSLGFGPKLIGMKRGDTEYLISAVPLGGYVKMLGEDSEGEIADEDKAKAFNFQPLWKRTIIVLAGPVFNMALTLFTFICILAMGFPINIPVLSRLLPVVEEVSQGYPAFDAGLRTGDVVEKINTVKIDTWFDMVNIVAKNPGKNLVFVVRRGHDLLRIEIVPRAVEESTPDGKKVVIGRIGVKKSEGGLYNTVQSSSPPDAIFKGVIATFDMAVSVFDSVEMLVTGKLSANNIGGPITIVRESGKAASVGFLAYIMFMALISMNLGMLNLIPIPVLDGGHILFFAIEALRRKPLSEKVMMAAQRAGLAIIVTLMVFAFYNDIVRWITGTILP